MKQFILKLVLQGLTYLIPKLSLPKDGDAGVVVMLCHEHVPMLIGSLSSFYYFLKQYIPCLIIDDGSLTQKDRQKILSLFQNIKIIDSSKSKEIALKKLKKYPYCLKHRRENGVMNNFNIKLFDTILTSKFKKIVLLDADILFLNQPTEIKEWINSSSQNSLYARHFIYSNFQREEVDEAWLIILRMFRERINSKIDFGFNSGLICLNRSAYKLQRVEKILKYMYEVGLGETWAPEQYIFSTILAETKNKYLGDKYVHTHSTREYEKQITNPFDHTAIHFAFLAKPKYYKLAIRLCLRTNCFRSS